MTARGTAGLTGAGGEREALMVSTGGHQDWYGGLGLSSRDGGADTVDDSAVRVLSMTRLLRKAAVAT